MIAEPKTLSSDIADRLNRLTVSDSVDELALQRAKNDIEKLMSIDKVRAYMLSGVACLIKKDSDGFVDNFLKSIELSPNNYETLFNFAKLLRGTGKNFTALEYARRAHQISKAPSILNLLIEITACTARFKESYGYFIELEKMKKVESKDFIDTAIIEFMNRNNISDDEISFVVERAYLLTTKNNVEIKNIKSSVYHDGSEEWIDIDLFINASPKQAVKLEVDFADELVVSIPESFPISKISCGFAPV